MAVELRGAWGEVTARDNQFREVSVHQNLPKTTNLLTVQPLVCHPNSSVPSLRTASLCSYVYCT